MSDSAFYVTGGTLRQDAPSYVERQADKDLLENLLKGEFCYVLTSRQMGKSSLMVRTAVRLRACGVTVAVLDLTAVGQNLSPVQWYNGLLTRLGTQIRLEDELDDFWFDHEKLGPCQRFFAAIEQIALPSLRKRRPKHDQGTALSSNNSPALPNGNSPDLVIFIDELDTVRSLPFSTDEFFAAIRECHTRRVENAAFNLLTFGLLGVATPSDLIRDTRLTPFNIGRRIELTDFTEHEARPLADALGRLPRIASLMLRRILFWTDGHPYLTQRLCQAVLDNPGVSGRTGVDKLCREIFFSHRARERDDNLLFVRERLLRNEGDLINLLRLYRRVHRSTRLARLVRFTATLRKIEPVADEEANPLVSILRLSGVTRAEKGVLRVRNRIYYRVFDPHWVERNMPVAELWRRWLIVWGILKRGAKFIAGTLFLLLLSATVIAVWMRPWEVVRFERPRRSALRVARPKPPIPPRSAEATASMIDLTDLYNAALDKAWHPGSPAHSFASLPAGLQNLDGITFDVRGVVQLAGGHLWREGFPERLSGIRIGQRCQRIHFLHGTGWNVAEGSQIGNYVIHYADGKRRFIPILYGQDVSDWLVPLADDESAPAGNVVWQEQAPPAKSKDWRAHRLFKSTWINPFPEIEIQSLDYVSLMTDAAPFLVAVSVEP
jgi:hypothetical protein